MDGVSLPNASTFADVGLAFIGCNRRGSLKIRNRRYIAHFGMKSSLVAIVWRELVESGWIKVLHVCPPKPEHLFGVCSSSTTTALRRSIQVTSIAVKLPSSESGLVSMQKGSPILVESL
jgi:hypothetical protein